jgi:hypothetical protein
MNKNILPTNALFIKNIKCYNVYLTPTCFGPSWTIIRECTLCLAKVTVSLKYQLKYSVEIAVVQWQ